MIKLFQKLMSTLNYMQKFYIEEEVAMKGLGDYVSSDKDLLKSLEINPDDAYVLNYLAYSWLEREYKIDLRLFKCLKKLMLKK